MPIYEFICAACNRESEVLLRTSDWSGTVCPHCGSEKITKKLSLFSSTAARSAPEFPSCTGDPGECGRCQAGMGNMD